jgi:cellulose synthase/poly-beta-1,6-N-acetylglucosamine synthase-like glycosyltransferase
MKVTLLIPCWNEEKMIKNCVDSAISQTSKIDQILVVDDCSTDKSAEILESFGDKITVIKTPKRMGNKSYAQEYAMNFISCDILVMTDGDTVLDKDFIKYIKKSFEDENIHAVAGYIESLKNNWITGCREIDYIIGQDIHKKAQYHIESLMVIPGCAGAFRYSSFRKYINFDHDTVTEDLDFTYKFHENDLKIAYNPKAIVYTQDPWNLRSYIGQMRRWIGGGWQNMLKHKKIISSRPGHALELGLIYFEGLIFGSLFFILPIINILYFIDFAIGYFVIAFIFGLYASIKRKRKDLIVYAPMFPLILIINSLIFFEQFIKEVIFRRKNLAWFTAKRA